MKHFCKICLCSMVILLTCGTAVFASENVQIMGVQDQRDHPVLFIAGVEGEVISAEALIGSVEADDVTITPISEEEISIRTLILLDNSLSIPEASRENVKNIVYELMASRSSNEQFLVATFGEAVEELTEFTSDYTQLKQSVEGIDFQDRETYLTDVLYDLLENDRFRVDENPVYSRIFVISDGVDNKALGYTTEELYALLEEKGVPIYALGVYNRNQTNEEELKNMFALSRQTNAEAFMLNELEEYSEIIDVLAEDREILRFDIIPAAESRDGGEKTISLKIQTAGGEVSVQADDVRMIQAMKVPEEEPVEVVKEETDAEPVAEETGISRQTLMIGVVLVGVMIGIALVVLLVFRVMKKKKEKNAIREIKLPMEQDGGDEDKTILILNDPEGEDNGNTIQMFDQYHCCQIILTDVNSPARSFKKEIISKVVIGRSVSKADICIDYDQSVSSRHCMIEKRGDKFYLVDLQAKNYTYWNDNRVLSEVEIHSGGIIKMGRVKLRVEVN